MIQVKRLMGISCNFDSSDIRSWPAKAFFQGMVPLQIIHSLFYFSNSKANKKHPQVVGSQTWTVLNKQLVSGINMCKDVCSNNDNNSTLR